MNERSSGQDCDASHAFSSPIHTLLVDFLVVRHLDMRPEPLFLVATKRGPEEVAVMTELDSHVVTNDVLLFTVVVTPTHGAMRCGHL